MLWLKTTLLTIIVPGIGVFLVPYYIIKANGFPLVYSPLQVVFGILLIIIGCCGFVWVSQAFVRFGKGTPAPFDPPKQFVATGLYRFVRNPMYIGALTAIVGESILFKSWQVLIYAAFLFLAFHIFVVFFEEKSLEKRFGEPYTQYLRSVPRWIPRPPKEQSL